MVDKVYDAIRFLYFYIPKEEIIKRFTVNLAENARQIVLKKN